MVGPSRAIASKSIGDESAWRHGAMADDILSQTCRPGEFSHSCRLGLCTGRLFTLSAAKG